MRNGKVDQIVSEMSYCTPPLSPEANLRNELGIDSLKMVELIIALEDAFDVKLDEADLDPANFEVVDDLYRRMEKYGR